MENADKDGISADLWIPELIKDMEKGMKAKLSPNGGSMLPFIVGGRDEALLVLLQKLKRGDVVLYRRNNGTYVLHRIHHIVNKNGEEQYYMIGDSQVEIEGPLDRTQILGMAESFIRKGKRFSKHHIGYKIWFHSWLFLRIFRPQLIHLWWGIHKLLGKDDYK